MANIQMIQLHRNTTATMTIDNDTIVTVFTSSSVQAAGLADGLTDEDIVGSSVILKEKKRIDFRRKTSQKLYLLIKS